jgi:hypothetical protein
MVLHLLTGCCRGLPCPAHWHSRQQQVPDSRWSAVLDAKARIWHCWQQLASLVRGGGMPLHAALLAGCTSVQPSKLEVQCTAGYCDRQRPTSTTPHSIGRASLAGLHTLGPHGCTSTGHHHDAPWQHKKLLLPVGSTPVAECTGVQPSRLEAQRISLLQRCGPHRTTSTHCRGTCCRHRLS